MSHATTSQPQQQKLLKASATNLALLASEEACHVCWTTLATLRWKRPFVKPMPAIMQYHDRTQKWLLQQLIHRDQKLPACFRPFQKVVGVAPIVRVEHTDPETGLFVYGLPDLLPEKEDGGLFVIDCKSAQPKGDDSPLYWIYRAQVNIYAWLLAQGAHKRRVDGAALFYFRWPDWLGAEDVLDYWLDDCLCAPLEPVIRSVEIDFDDVLRPLIDLAYGLLSGERTPQRNPQCPDCEALEAFLKAQAQLNTDFRLAFDAQSRQRLYARQRYLDACSRAGDLPKTHKFFPPNFGHPEGIIANWNYDDGLI